MSQNITKKFGFTLIELLVVISIIALLLGILVPVLGVAKKNANILKESVNLRNIHAAFATYGTSNKDWFPGITSAGKPQGWDTVAGAATSFIGKYYAAATNASTATALLNDSISATSDFAQAVIMDESGSTPAQWISPGETSTTGGNAESVAPLTAAAPPAAGGVPAITDATTGSVGQANNSFAVLGYGATSLKAEWKSNQNQMAVVAGTRVIGDTAADFDTDASNSFNTVWTDDNSGAYKGSMVRGDTSTTTENFKRSSIRDTFGTLKYGSITGQVAQVATADVVGPYVHADVDGTVVSGIAAGNMGATATTGTLDTGMIGSANN